MSNDIRIINDSEMTYSNGWEYRQGAAQASHIFQPYVVGNAYAGRMGGI